MNIEKIKNYNQFMLSIITSIAVAFGIIGLISLIIFLLNDVFRVFNKSSDYQETGISIYDSTINQNGNELNKLYIAWNFPELIDSTNQIYVIPIGHKTNQELQNDYLKLSSSVSKSYGGFDSRSDYSSEEKRYVNMMIYDGKSGKSEILFKQKLLIGEFRAQYYKDDILLTMEAALADTNNDKNISFDDQTSLFIYSIHNKSLRQLKYTDKSVLYFEKIPNTKDFLIKFGLEASKRDENKSNTDLSILCRYNYDQDQLVVINDEKIQKELNGIVDKK
jgi:hypothetical protein